MGMGSDLGNRRSGLVDWGWTIMQLSEEWVVDSASFGLDKRWICGKERKVTEQKIYWAEHLKYPPEPTLLFTQFGEVANIPFGSQWAATVQVNIFYPTKISLMQESKEKQKKGKSDLTTIPPAHCT